MIENFRNTKGKVFVVSASAGTGKTTLVKKLLKEFPRVKASISTTTRKPRANEVDGVDYIFVSREEFERKIEEKEFLEYVELYGNYYGTSKKCIETLQSQGNHVILVIDTQGGLKIKSLIEAVLIFILPPTFEELKKRLYKRKSETPSVNEKRLEWIKHEIEDAKKYDYVLVNDKIKIAYEILRSILIAEEHHII